MTARPAFSTAFEAEQLELLEALEPIEDITPDWAWGGTTGKGVKVAVVDSGVDADHPVIDGRVAGYMAISVSPRESSCSTTARTRTCRATALPARVSSSASRPSASCTASG